MPPPLPSIDPRPTSAVSHGVGIAGVIGLGLWALVANHHGLMGPFAALTALAMCGVPMMLWSLLVDRVHRAPSTGIDWLRPPRPLGQTLPVSAVKLAGLWVTWALIGGVYALGRWYWQGGYLFAMETLVTLLPILLVASPIYLLWLDRRLDDPHDGAYAFGLLLLGRARPGDDALVAGHLRAWAVKGFFTAFMLSILPGNWQALIGRDTALIFRDPVALANWAVAGMFMVDVVFATVGYLMTFRPLDSHIRSANPFAAGWAAALICYPPFIMMGPGAPLDYHPGTREWSDWLAGQTLALALVGAALVLLTAVYAWATVAFGLRFSNLTHRGILTHGPYRWSKHPAYLSKTLFWWLATMPFLTTGSAIEAVRNCAILGAVTGIYYWRARTEERHLSADPAYRAYADWMARNAPIPRLLRRLGISPRQIAARQP